MSTMACYLLGANTTDAHHLERVREFVRLGASAPPAFTNTGRSIPGRPYPGQVLTLSAEPVSCWQRRLRPAMPS